jgi:hypothetical protein
MHDVSRFVTSTTTANCLSIRLSQSVAISNFQYTVHGANGSRLVITAHCVYVFAECNFSQPLLDPDPDDDNVKVIYDAYITQINLKEEIENIEIAVFNCKGKTCFKSFYM